MRDNIAIMGANNKRVNMNSETSQIQDAEDLLQATFVPDDIPPIGDFCQTEEKVMLSYLPRW